MNCQWELRIHPAAHLDTAALGAARAVHQKGPSKDGRKIRRGQEAGAGVWVELAESQDGLGRQRGNGRLRVPQQVNKDRQLLQQRRQQLREKGGGVHSTARKGVPPEGQANSPAHAAGHSPAPHRTAR